MRKRDELDLPDSCLNRSTDNELLFILCARDVAMPETIRFWVRQRILHGYNKWTDPKIKEALALARRVEAEHHGQSS